MTDLRLTFIDLWWPQNLAFRTYIYMMYIYQGKTETSKIVIIAKKIGMLNIRSNVWSQTDLHWPLMISYVTNYSLLWIIWPLITTIWPLMTLIDHHAYTPNSTLNTMPDSENMWQKRWGGLNIKKEAVKWKLASTNQPPTHPPSGNKSARGTHPFGTLWYNITYVYAI